MNFELAKRTKRHPLSRPQLEVLRKLAAEGACPTSTSTTGRYVAGTATAALERRGLVFARTEPLRADQAWPDRVYEITDAGRKVLARATKADE